MEFIFISTSFSISYHVDDPETSTETLSPFPGA